MKNKQDVIPLLNQAARQFSKSFNEKMAPTGLFVAQWAVIRFLMNNGPSTQIAMSSSLNIEAPSMTRTITRMEKAGLIIRKEGQDRREKMIHLTDFAKGKISEWEQEVNQFEEPLFDQLSQQEIEAAEKVLRTIIYKLKQQDETGGTIFEERQTLD
ncbi:MarR family winged helix-turn-helix transcriptional regulator [Bacillus massiliigorillae]|uniref:MarR family winged helix-turn-helix transcriptional regulator n=1 Tax=Bacillus massiliigorillae TaxID=1243664 RepID=UPI00039C7A7F|nr:MarR family transcriptional regulator [Bacillus massiliigorillae]